MNSYLSPNYDLSAHNTFGLAARSAFGRRVVSAAELPGLFEMAAQKNLPVRVLGGGSNVILSADYPGITAIMANRGRGIRAEADDRVSIEAEAGENWHELVAHTVAQGLWGLENLAGIPGTVGAAPIQNIGAYGVELSDRFVSLTAFDRKRQSFVDLAGAACRFAYRRSLFKEEPERYVVSRVRLQLSRSPLKACPYRELASLGTPDNPAIVMNEVLRLRASKIPDWRVLGNAGSFFRNPIVETQIGADFKVAHPQAPAFEQADGKIKLSAGWLIEQAGLKGHRQGGAGVAAQHALVLVNHGHATYGDVLALVAHIVATVQARFGITLQREAELL